MYRISTSVKTKKNKISVVCLRNKKPTRPKQLSIYQMLIIAARQLISNIMKIVLFSHAKNNLKLDAYLILFFLIFEYVVHICTFTNFQQNLFWHIGYNVAVLTLEPVTYSFGSVTKYTFPTISTETFSTFGFLTISWVPTGEGVLSVTGGNGVSSSLRLPETCLSLSSFALLESLPPLFTFIGLLNWFLADANTCFVREASWM